jgi:hypothetical protein
MLLPESFSQVIHNKKTENGADVLKILQLLTTDTAHATYDANRT